MWTRRSEIAVLIAGFLLALSANGVRDVKDRNPYDVNRAAGTTKRQSLSQLPSRPFSVCTYSPWRSRLKSVLEESSPRIIEASDLVTVLIPTQMILLGCNGLNPCPRLTTLPLRC